MIWRKCSNIMLLSCHQENVSCSNKKLLNWDMGLSKVVLQPNLLKERLGYPPNREAGEVSSWICRILPVVHTRLFKNRYAFECPDIWHSHSSEKECSHSVGSPNASKPSVS